MRNYSGKDDRRVNENERLAALETLVEEGFNHMADSNKQVADSLGKSIDTLRSVVESHVKEENEIRVQLNTLQNDFNSMKFGTRIVLRIAATLPFAAAAIYAAVRWMVSVE